MLQNQSSKQAIKQQAIDTIIRMGKRKQQSSDIEEGTRKKNIKRTRTYYLPEVNFQEKLQTKYIEPMFEKMRRKLEEYEHEIGWLRQTLEIFDFHTCECRVCHTVITEDIHDSDIKIKDVIKENEWIKCKGLECKRNPYLNQIHHNNPYICPDCFKKCIGCKKLDKHTQYNVYCSDCRSVIGVEEGHLFSEEEHEHDSFEPVESTPPDTIGYYSGCNDDSDETPDDDIWYRRSSESSLSDDD